MIHTVHLTDSFLPMPSFQLSKESVTSLLSAENLTEFEDKKI